MKTPHVHRWVPFHGEVWLSTYGGRIILKTCKCPVWVCTCGDNIKIEHHFGCPHGG